MPNPTNPTILHPIGQSTNLIGRVNLSDKWSGQVSVLKLEEESQVQRDFHVVEVEVPGQYFTDQVSLNLTIHECMILVFLNRPFIW